MPELPEVEVVRRGLAEHAQGRRIERVEVLHPRALRRQTEGAAHFGAVLTGRTVTATARRGKFLWLATDDPDVVLTAHLGMSGQFRVDWPVADQPRIGAVGSADPATAQNLPRPVGDWARHARVHFDLGREQLWFIDQRTFGWVAVCGLVPDASGRAVPELVRTIAADPTEPGFDVRAVAKAMRRRRVEVKRLLLDQSLVSGIGNIYADEALWRAQVHPRRRADRLTLSALSSVLEAASSVMAASLERGGTSFDQLYVNVNGRSGYFARDLAVYGRADLPCVRCGALILRERFMNRSSHLCPTCQRPPRTQH